MNRAKYSKKITFFCKGQSYEKIGNIRADFVPLCLKNKLCTNLVVHKIKIPVTHEI